jgi:hypothetical protein
MPPCTCSAAAQRGTRETLCKSCVAAKKSAARAHNPLPAMLRDAKFRAKRDGIPFSITSADVKMPATCPILGIPLMPKPANGKPGPWIYSPSLDKIVPELGYVPGNIQILSARANTLKSNGSLEELVAIGKFAERRLRERRLDGLGDRPATTTRRWYKRAPGS